MRGRSLITFFCSIIIAGGLFVGGSLTIAKPHDPFAQDKKYKIYCVNGKIEIGTRNLDEMKSARGNQVCLKGSFDSFEEAMDASKRQGGVGSACSCP
jgi:hypothetical protein